MFEFAPPGTPRAETPYPFRIPVEKPPRGRAGRRTGGGGLDLGGGGWGFDLGAIGLILLLLVVAAVLFGVFVGLPWFIGALTWGPIHAEDIDTEGPLAGVATAAGYAVLAAALAAWLLSPLPMPGRAGRRMRRPIRTMVGLLIGGVAILVWFGVLPGKDREARARIDAATTPRDLKEYVGRTRSLSMVDWSTQIDRGASSGMAALDCCESPWLA